MIYLTYLICFGISTLFMPKYTSKVAKLFYYLAAMLPFINVGLAFYASLRYIVNAK